jgi:translation initiation factor IF-2
MAEKRVHEIAKERGMSASDALLKLRAAGFDVTAAASTVDEAAAVRALGGNGAATATPRPASSGQRAAQPGQRPAQPGQRAAQPGQRPGQPGQRAAQPGEPPAQPGQPQQRAPRRVFEPDGPPLKVTPRSQREAERPRPVLPPRPPAARGPA